MSATPFEHHARTSTAARRVFTHAPARPGWGVGALALDSVMLLVAVLAAGIGARAAGASSLPPAWALTFGVIVLLVLFTRGMYAHRLRVRTIDDVRVVAVATTTAALGLLALAALTGSGQPVADELVRLWAFAGVYVGVGRVGLYRSLVRARRAGEGLRPTLIVGAGKVGRLLAKRLIDAPELGLRPVGFLDKDPLEYAGDLEQIPVLGASWDLERAVEEHGVEQVVITFSTAPNDVLLRMVKRCEELGVAVAVVPRLYEKTTTHLTVEHLGGLPLLSARTADPHGWQFAVKYALDRVLAALGLVLVAPVLALAAGALLISVGRPLFFRQLRIGRDGQTFEILKFRTMTAPPTGVPLDFAPPEDLAPGGVEGDDRRTRLGSLLRRTSIDELPQLLNVLRGEMSLVGPRPERPEFVDRFSGSVYRYGDRHRVKSGITGWAQVHGLRGKTSIADRAEWDNHYIENFSLWLDLKILLMTAVAVVAVFKSVE